MSGRKATPDELRISEREHALAFPAPPPLKLEVLYLGDNGRAFCGAPKCAGATAYYSGRDLSGQPVLALTTREAIDHEGCGRQPALVTVS